MAIGSRLTVAGLVVAALTFVIGTTVVPTHATLGAVSRQCGTVLRPDRDGLSAPICGPAGANHLRAAVGVGAVLAVLAAVPVIVQWRRPGRRPALWAAWGVVTLATAVAGLTVLATVEYVQEGVFFDL